MASNADVEEEHKAAYNHADRVEYEKSWKEGKMIQYSMEYNDIEKVLMGLVRRGALRPEWVKRYQVTEFLISHTFQCKCCISFACSENVKQVPLVHICWTI